MNSGEMPPPQDQEYVNFGTPQDARAQQLIEEFRENFPTLPLVKTTPVPETGGIRVEDPLKDAIKNLAGDLRPLLTPDKVKEQIQSAADAVLAQKLGKERLPNEVEGRWDLTQGLQFKRSLAYAALVPPSYAKASHRERVHEVLTEVKYLNPLGILKTLLFESPGNKR